MTLNHAGSDMHERVANLAAANPNCSEEQLATATGCNVTIVRQAKTRFQEWDKKAKRRANRPVSIQRPASTHVPNYAIHSGDVLDILPNLPSDYFTGCLSDPPYELGFMGKNWDSTGIAFNPQFWAEMYRVLAPAAHLLAFGSSRTFHRLTAAIEDADFEIRDHVMWLYGTGFPKSRATLKPSYEPIVLARKPAKKNVALAIDACRINPGEVIKGGGANFSSWRKLEGLAGELEYVPSLPHDKGRYPTNLILDEEVAEDLGAESRYFYCPKASREERDRGLDNFAVNFTSKDAKGVPSHGIRDGLHHERAFPNRNFHPTVKPLALTKWLASLIKPVEGGRLLVPFAGSGSEMIGGLQAGWDDVVGVELTEEYVPVAHARIGNSLASKREAA